MSHHFLCGNFLITHLSSAFLYFFTSGEGELESYFWCFQEAKKQHQTDLYWSNISREISACHHMHGFSRDRLLTLSLQIVQICWNMRKTVLWMVKQGNIKNLHICKHFGQKYIVSCYLKSPKLCSPSWYFLSNELYVYACKIRKLEE